MEPSDMSNEISDTTWALSKNRHATLGYLNINRRFSKIVTGDMAIS